MRILYHAMIELGSHDGHSVHTQLIIDALRAVGHEVILVSPDGARVGGESLPFFGYSEARYWLYRRVLALKLPESIRRVRPDVVVDKLSPALPEVVRACRVANLPLVVEVNGGLGTDRVSDVIRRGVRALDTLPQALLLGVSPGLALQYRALAPATPYQLFENGAPDWPVPARSDLRSRLGIPDDDFVVGYVGSPNPTYAFAETIEALADLRRRGVPAHLFAAGPDPLRANLERLLVPHPELPRTFHPSVSHGEVASLYSVADAGFVVWREQPYMAGTAMKLREWLLSHRPVIVNGLSWWPDDWPLAGVVESIPDVQPESIADGLERIARDPAASRARAIRGGELIGRDYGWIRRADAYARIVEESALGELQPAMGGAR